MTSTVSPASQALPVGARISAALRNASARTGVAFDYLVGQANLESGLDPLARSASSSATGLFQFIDQTWLATVKKHGAAYGLGWAADAIEPGKDGRLQIADPVVRQEVLDLRKNPEAASAMAAEFAADNKDALEQALGRPVAPVDLYLAHFLGTGGAEDFLRAHDADPAAPAASLLPRAARANPSVFFNRDGSPKSLGEIRNRFAARIGGSQLPRPGSSLRLAAGEFIPLSTLGAADAGDAANPDLKLAAGEFIPLRTLRPGKLASMPFKAALSPEHARLAYLMLAELGG